MKEISSLEQKNLDKILHTSEVQFNLKTQSLKENWTRVPYEK